MLSLIGMVTYAVRNFKVIGKLAKCLRTKKFIRVDVWYASSRKTLQK